LQISWATIAGGVVESTTECSLQEVTDRGFAHDAPKYTFLNPHITPHFLAKRQQFTKGDIKIDRGVCTLRYTSEAVFSHIFDENTLKDNVPFNLFTILNDSWTQLQT
jgi:hypothetical protein